MPRRGKNHAQGGGEIAQVGGKFSRAQDSTFLSPLANFSCTPLSRNVSKESKNTFFFH